MSSHMFSAAAGKPSAAHEKRIDDLLRDLRVIVDMAQGKCWLVAPRSYGAPYDDRLESECARRLAAAGITMTGFVQGGSVAEYRRALAIVRQAAS